MALSRFTGRGRRPRLRVVAPTLSTPRRVIGWNVAYAATVSVEHWTEAEWDQLSEAERPEGAAFLPGAGWIFVKPTTGDEVRDVRDAYGAAMDRWRTERGTE